MLLANFSKLSKKLNLNPGEPGMFSWKNKKYTPGYALKADHLL